MSYQSQPSPWALGAIQVSLVSQCFHSNQGIDNVLFHEYQSESKIWNRFNSTNTNYSKIIHTRATHPTKSTAVAEKITATTTTTTTTTATSTATSTTTKTTKENSKRKQQKKTEMAKELNYNNNKNFSITIVTTTAAAEKK